MSTHAGVGDATVKAKTGRDWSEWIAVLDRAGAARLAHPHIVALLRGRFKLESGWWCQMVTVGYEQAKGLRDVHQTTDGYAASVSKTMAAPVDAVFAAWNDSRRRRAWLPDALSIRKATPGKSLRIAWATGGNVDVYLIVKAARKTQVTIQHSKLADARSVAAMKALWKDALVRLAARLDS